VLLRLPAEQPLISRFHFWPLMDEVFSSGEDVPVFRGEVDVGTPAVPARFLSQKAQPLKPPQYLAHALPAHAENCRDIGNCSGFKDCCGLQCIQR